MTPLSMQPGDYANRGIGPNTKTSGVCARCARRIAEGDPFEIIHGRIYHPSGTAGCGDAAGELRDLVEGMDVDD